MTRIPIDDPNLDDERPGSPGAQGTADSDPVTAGARPRDQAAGDDELERVRSERDSLYERLARATADFQNIRKRQEQETDQRVQYANSNLIKALLPVIDNFERALAVDPSKADAASILKGMQIVHEQLIKVLQQQQVEEIAPAPGTPFDPTRHQALMHRDAAYPVPTVVQLLQKGYALHGRTLRPAQVAVSKSA